MLSRLFGRKSKSRANLKVTEKYDRTELRNYNYHHRTSKALPEYSSGGKYSPSDLEAYGTPLKLGRILNVKEIWHLVQDEVEKKYLGDNNSDEIVNSWPYDQGPYFCETKPPSPTPLVDGLTIECIDKASLFERNNNAEDFGDFDIHESYNEDHAASCPTLDEKCNFVTPENEDLAFHLLYSHLNSSNSSSTSGVIDVDFSSSSSRSQDGQKKRRDFIRSSHRMESGSQTSHSMESNTEIGASLPRHRSPSFRAAIESHSNINLLSATNSNNYLTPTSYQSNNQSEFLQCSRNRSLSFQAAIEDGQHSPTDTNDTDVIPASADTTPDNPNIAEGLALDTYGKTLSSGRTDSRSVNFQLNTTETDIRTEPLSSGNSSQYLKSIDDPYHGSLLKSDEYKKSFRAGMNQEVEVSVTYASPSTSLDSSTSDVPKKSCIRDSSLQKSTSNAEEASFVNSGETSLKTTRAPESELEMSPKKQLQSRNIRKLGVHSMDLPKKSIFQDEMVNSESLKNSNSCSQKPQEISSISKPAEETTVKKTDSETEEVTEDSKPDDSSGISENTTQLSKLREPSCLTSNESNSTLNLKVLRKKDNNLARKREQMKHMKMPELTELVENTSECNDSSKAFSTANTLLQPPASSDNMVLPSISDAFLMEFRVFVDQYANFSAEDLTEQEIENKFRDLSLAFKTDKQTLHQRLQIHKNSRDLAEENVGKELQSLRGASKALLQLSDSQTIDSQIQDAAKNIQNYVDVLEQAIGRISGRAEVFGAVKQEERMSCAMEIMMSYVESLKRIQEKELEEAKTLLDNKILNSEAGGDSSSLSRRAASLSNAPKTTKRRASMAALSKNPSQIGPNSQTPMGIMNKQEVYHRRSTLPAGKLLRHVSSFEKDQDSSEDLIDNIPIIDPTLLGTKEEQEKNEFRVGYRNGVGMKMDTMFEGLIQQQPNLVHVQNLMAETDLDNTSNKKLTLFVEVFREFQSDIASIWKGLNPFTQYTSIFIFATLTLVAILLPMFRRLNIAVDEKYYDMPPF
ncbi:uncharacterized protein LOC106874321 [Argonauta hians]